MIGAVGPVLTIDRSASVSNGESSESVLFPGIGSGVVDETDAVLVIVPVTVGSTSTTTSTIA